MHITLALNRPTHVQPSPRVLQIAGMFGLGVDETRSLTIIPPTTLELNPGMIIFITGPSGGGKSTLLSLIGQALHGDSKARVLRFEDLPALPEVPLVDALASADALPLPRVLELLSLAGLADAFVLLRKPSELSDGQRYRLRLAQTMAQAQREDDRLCVILADEFGASLDRITAQVIARNLRKWTRRSPSPICFIAATTHDDLLEPLDPDVLIEKGLGSAIEVAVKEVTR